MCTLDGYNTKGINNVGFSTDDIEALLHMDRQYLVICEATTELIYSLEVHTVVVVYHSNYSEYLVQNKTLELLFIYIYLFSFM